MFIWENLRRLNEIVSFKNLVTQYFNSARYSWQADGLIENDKAIETRTKINLVIDKIHTFIKEAGVSPSIYYSPPPAVGGLAGSIDLVTNIFNLHRFQIPHQDLLDVIERAIGVYSNDKRNSLLRTINPLFWIHTILEILISLPLRLLGSIGFNRTKIENSLIGRIYKFVTEIILVIAAVLSILERIGSLERLKSLLGSK